MCHALDQVRVYHLHIDKRDAFVHCKEVMYIHLHCTAVIDIYINIQPVVLALHGEHSPHHGKGFGKQLTFYINVDELYHYARQSDREEVSHSYPATVIYRFPREHDLRHC